MLQWLRAYMLKCGPGTIKSGRRTHSSCPLTPTWTQCHTCVSSIMHSCMQTGKMSTFPKDDKLGRRCEEFRNLVVGSGSGLGYRAMLCAPAPARRVRCMLGASY